MRIHESNGAYVQSGFTKFIVTCIQPSRFTTSFPIQILYENTTGLLALCSPAWTWLLRPQLPLMPTTLSQIFHLFGSYTLHPLLPVFPQKPHVLQPLTWPVMVWLGFPPKPKSTANEQPWKKLVPKKSKLSILSISQDRDKGCANTLKIRRCTIVGSL